MHVRCAKCSRQIALSDVIESSNGQLAHLDCARAKALTPEERALLFVYCFGHVVAQCPNCDVGFRMTELASDLGGSRTNLCTKCRADLTEHIRDHLYGCAMLPSEVRHRAKEVREAAQHLVKQSQQAIDKADVLIREAEAHLFERQHALRTAMARRAH